jgi:exopolyphosphatase / guanosine-5'-triphosphate,3'-diphosphate pyrophosphatase
MPTLYWLVGKRARLAIDRLEAAGGVRAAEAAVDPGELEEAHARYSAERDAAIPPRWEGPRPSGGVGGTRRGVKCLHAHYAWLLAGGNDPVGRWVAEQLAGGPAPGLGAAQWDDALRRPAGEPKLRARTGQAVAAIDCGTLSTRLLVAGADGAPTVRLMRLTGLGKGVDAGGEVAAASVGRVLAVLREYRAVMDRNEVGRVLMVGTSALRDATNRGAFSDDAARIVGTELRLLTGEEEAELSFSGATQELARASGPWLVADVGGGSTELAFGPPLAACSLDVGCVRLTERFFAHDPPAADELDEARSWLEREYRAAEESVPQLRSGRALVGLAGTVAALACFDQGLRSYQREAVHHYKLHRDAVARALVDLASQPAHERAGRPGIEAARAPYILGGALTLETLMAHFGFDECLVSESDILDGMVAHLLSLV